jgi:hypothetical protein
MDRETRRGLIEAAKAVGIVVLIIAALTLPLVLTGCSWYREHPPEVRVFAAVDPSGNPFGRNPSGHILITQPLPGYFELSALHGSSIPDFDDRANLNAFGVGVCVRIPLKRCE